MALLPALAFFALAFFALALAESGQSVAKALQNIASGIPVLGSALGSLFGQLAHALAWAAGQLYQGIDAMMGAVFHALAWVLEQTFAMYREQAIALLHLSQYAAGQLTGVSGLRATIARQERELHGIEHGVRTLAKEYKGIDEQVRKIERELGAGIGNDIRLHIKALERAINTVETKTIPDVQAGVRTAEADVTALQDYVTKNFVSDASLATDAVAAGVLTAAGVSWLRCNSNPFNRNPGACGLWGDLSTLLGLFAAGFALADLFTIVEGVQKIEVDAVKVMTDLVHVEEEVFGVVSGAL